MKSKTIVFTEAYRAEFIETETKEIKISVRALRNEITDHIIEYAALHPQVTFKTFFDFGKTDSGVVVAFWQRHHKIEVCKSGMVFKDMPEQGVVGERLYQ